MKAFRVDNSEETGSLVKQIAVGIIILSIVVSFVWQMSLGLCPVP